MDLRSPINPYREDYDLLFDEQIYGAEMGYYHNCVITSLFDNNGKDMFDWSIEEIQDSTIEQVLDLLIAENPDVARDVLHECLRIVEEDGVDAPENPYVERYLFSVQELESPDKKSYTEDFMRIIQQEIVDEQEVLLINGSISTYFYSSCLWKPYIPTMYEGLYVCHDDHNAFMLETYDENFIHNMAADESITFIGVPVIRNNQIESLFVFDDMRILSTASWNDYIYQQDSNQWIFEPTDDIIFPIHGTEYVIRQGTYQFDRFDGGYVVFL